MRYNFKLKFRHFISKKGPRRTSAPTPRKGPCRWSVDSNRFVPVNVHFMISSICTAAPVVAVAVAAGRPDDDATGF